VGLKFLTAPAQRAHQSEGDAPIRGSAKLSGRYREKEGIHFDLNGLTPRYVDELLANLAELSIDVDRPEGSEKVRVFSE